MGGTPVIREVHRDHAGPCGIVSHGPKDMNSQGGVKLKRIEAACNHAAGGPHSLRRIVLVDPGSAPVVEGLVTLFGSAHEAEM